MKSYLLGTLEENSAASLEERYFTDREFFLFVQAVETALIEDYLADRLAPSVRNRFETRYLSVPGLSRRVEEVRHKLERTHSPVRYTRLLLSATILLICVGGPALWIYLGRMRIKVPQPQAGTRPLLATVTLSPGLLKGENTSAARIGAPSGRGDIKLLLELPGQRTEVLCSAGISLGLPNGRWKRIWLTPKPVWSTAFTGEQRLVLIIDSSLLARGDYLVEAVGVVQPVHETYYLHVSLM